ncbi:MAG TPA: hypothetical protein VE267_02375, partial [Bradyrhizobium sp.]|nr:hypothetical protein [Bradyrhizobium sp.]
MRVEANFLKPINAIWVVQPSSKKYPSSLVGQISATSLRHPGPQEGRFAIVMNVDRAAMDAAARETNALTRTTKSCGPDAP